MIHLEIMGDPEQQLLHPWGGVDVRVDALFLVTQYDNERLSTTDVNAHVLIAVVMVSGRCETDLFFELRSVSLVVSYGEIATPPLPYADNRGKGNAGSICEKGHSFIK